MSKLAAMKTVTIIGLFVLAFGVWSMQAQAEEGGRAASAPEASYPTLSNVPDQVVTDLGSFEVEIGAENKETSPAVDLKTATDVARANFGLAGDVPAASATLARVTTNEYGRELETNPAKPSRIDPAINNDLVWIVTFEKAITPLFGPSGEGASSYQEGPLVVFVGSEKPDFLYALSY